MIAGSAIDGDIAVNLPSLGYYCHAGNRTTATVDTTVKMIPVVNT